MILTFTPTVGVAPGTTTMQLGCLGGCPKDSIRSYTSPPRVMTQASYAQPSDTIYDPYTSMVRLRGFNGLGESPTRWGLVLVAGLAVFAAVLAYRRR